MSIYLEFPSIDDYPFYIKPLDHKLDALTEDMETKIMKEEMNVLQDYLFLRLI